MNTLISSLKLKRFMLVPLAALLTVAAGCRVEQEQAGELPDVDVEVSPGELPEYDVEGPEVSVRTTKRTVTVPRVEVVQEERIVEVPYVDVQTPGMAREEQVLTAEVEAPSGGYNLEIQNVYMTEDEILVVARLIEEDPNIPETPVTISDSIVLNAPTMPVRYYIVGESPVATPSGDYTVVDDPQTLESELSSAQPLYSRDA